MNSNIRQAIEIIDQRIAHLQNIRKMLLDEFGGDGGYDTTISVASHRGTNGNGQGGTKTRRAELIDFLRKHGPSKRKQILIGTSIPKGTIATLLNKPPFVRGSDGRWSMDLAEVSASQETTH